MIFLAYFFLIFSTIVMASGNPQEAIYLVLMAIFVAKVSK